MATPDISRRKFLTLTAGVPVIASQQAKADKDKSIPLAPPDKQPEGLEVRGAPEKQLGWAIVGLGNLSLTQILPAFGEARLSKPTAFVSGHPEKAKKTAAALGVDPKNIYNYENFDTIADNPDIDVVYIVLPPSMHAEFTIRALRAGKHVLCEKPMAVTVEESLEMEKVAKETGKTLGIAYRLHFEPLNRQVMEWCREKKFGEIKTFSSSNNQNVKAPNIRLSSKLGGGPVGDTGVYSINAARYTIGEEPTEVMAYAHQPKDDPRFAEVPESVVYIMKYPSGAIATCDCSFGSAESRRYEVHCAGGTIEMDPSFSYSGLKLSTSESIGERANKVAEIGIPQINQFAAEMDGFTEAILAGEESRIPASMGIADMRIVEAIYESIESGAPVKIKG